MIGARDNCEGIVWKYFAQNLAHAITGVALHSLSAGNEGCGCTNGSECLSSAASGRGGHGKYDQIVMGRIGEF